MASFEKVVSRPAFKRQNKSAVWHAGAGIDSPTIPDLHKKWLEKEDVSILRKKKKG